MVSSMARRLEFKDGNVYEGQFENNNAWQVNFL